MIKVRAERPTRYQNGRSLGDVPSRRLIDFLRAMRILSIYLLAGLFAVAGVAHFVRPQLFVRIVPPYLPAPLLLVYVSGALEVLGGLGLLVPGARVLAGWSLIALLIAVFPANVHMALHPEAFPQVPAWSLYARLPLQFVLMGWVYWAACV